MGRSKLDSPEFAEAFVFQVLYRKLNESAIVELGKDGNNITDAKVKIKVFMPEMPGMPYMEYKAKAKLVEGKYKMMLNFSMGGTWQYHLKFKSKDGKIHTVRGSVNI